jgi:hypothetical protein
MLLSIFILAVAAGILEQVTDAFEEILKDV